MYVAKKGDDLDAALERELTGFKLKFPIKKYDGGYYIFGTKKIFIKVLLERLVVRVGTGFLPFQEFMNSYYDREVETVFKKALELNITVEEVVRQIEDQYAG